MFVVEPGGFVGVGLYCRSSAPVEGNKGLCSFPSRRRFGRVVVEHACPA